MTPPARGLIDTSVLIARESGREVAHALLPVELAISVVTLAELNAGVLAAANTATRARRLRTLDIVSDMAVLAIDEAAAVEWSRMRVFLAEQQRRIGINDLWIAATALAHGLPVVSQDDDFAVLEGAGLSVIKV